MLDLSLLDVDMCYMRFVCTFEDKVDLISNGVSSIILIIYKSCICMLSVWLFELSHYYNTAPTIASHASLCFFSLHVFVNLIFS